MQQRVGGQLTDQERRVTGERGVAPLEDEPGGAVPAEDDAVRGGRVVDAVLAEEGGGGGGYGGLLG